VVAADGSGSAGAIANVKQQPHGNSKGPFVGMDAAAGAARAASGRGAGALTPGMVKKQSGVTAAAAAAGAFTRPLLSST
jgi:hypothetical protein